jgi:large subunit ribosomal protein L17
MLKKVFGKKLSRERGARRALFRALIRALVANHAIVTTRAKAKAVQRDVDKLLVYVMKGSVNSRRLALSYMGNDKETVDRLFGELKYLVEKRKSGFTRIVAMPARRGDAAEMARLEFVDKPTEKKGPAKGEVKKNENISTKGK